MLITRQALNAALFSSNDATRLALNYIRVDPDGIVWASNSHVAVKVTQTAETITDTDYPAISGIPDEAKDPISSILIPANVALDVAKALGKLKRAVVPVLTRALIRVTDTTVYLATTDLERPNVVTFRMSSEIFPRLETVYPKADKKAEAEPFGINASYLALVAAFEKCFEQNKVTRPIKVTAYGAKDPISFEWSGSGVTAHAIVMPVR